MRKIVTAVLHDGDGVIFDSLPQSFKAYNPLFKWKNISMSYEEYKRKMVGDYNDFLRGIGFKESELQQAADMWNAEYRKYYHEVSLFPGTRQYLKMLREDGMKIAIVSGGSRRRINIDIDRFGIRNFFDAVVTREDTLNAKPHPEPILFALQKLGCRADESVYVGDADSDIIAAKLSGTKSIFITGGISEVGNLSVKPDGVVESFSELYEAISKF